MVFFNWRCAKSGKSIAIEHSSVGAIPCVLVTPFGNIVEHNYNPKTGKNWSSTMCFAWFVWEHGYDGEPVLKWL